MNLKTHSNAFSSIKSKNPNPYTVRKQLSPWLIQTSLLGLESSSLKQPLNSHPCSSRPTYLRALLKWCHKRHDFPDHLTYINSPSTQTFTLLHFLFFFIKFIGVTPYFLFLPRLTYHMLLTFLMCLFHVPTTRMHSPWKQGPSPSRSLLHPQQNTSGL